MQRDIQGGFPSCALHIRGFALVLLDETCAQTSASLRAHPTFMGLCPETRAYWLMSTPPSISGLRCVTCGHFPSCAFQFCFPPPAMSAFTARAIPVNGGSHLVIFPAVHITILFPAHLYCHVSIPSWGRLRHPSSSNGCIRPLSTSRQNSPV